MTDSRSYRAGESIEDFCRACKTDRWHTVIAADAGGRPVRVSCGYCHSDHNYRGGPRIDIEQRREERPKRDAGSQAAASARAPLPIVTDRERRLPAMTVNVDGAAVDLELLLRRVIREESGVTPVAPAEKWRGGMLVLRPANPALQEKSWPIETFFHKIVMMRNRLRSLEQQINAGDMPDAVKVRLQSYISGCYGSMTSFNTLFAEESDQFKGSGE
jgi:hypothetical protein